MQLDFARTLNLHVYLKTKLTILDILKENKCDKV